ncbi:MAG: hypothetical protein IJH84_01310 [Saccharopolyspora sp.]|uniref:hypothetical protein n=1 Tax=Saccharopolyspora sp. TaxID=33915 RepID=UPI0025F4A26B|nr:hypothetical protein [Saccharopolyspora sp.]MBQ6639652.1 hypothetical protein [Saccharopolyspora sp.]
MNDEVDLQSVLQSLAEQGGGLIEIYAFDTGEDEWRSVVEWLNGSGLILSVDADDGDSRVPQVVPDIFAVDGDVRTTMFCKVGRQRWWTSFYSPDCVDFQGDPEQVENISDVMDLIDFMKGISRSARRSTVLVAETTRPERTNPYIRVHAACEGE